MSGISAMFAKRAPRMTDAQRIQAAAHAGLKLDPIGRDDKIVIIVGFSTYGLTLLLVLYAWLNRNYRPIRAKNLVLITLMYITGAMWYLGGMVTNGLVSIVGVWSICKLWTIWVRLAFTYMFMCFLLFRTLALHRIFILNKPYKGWGYYMPIIILFAILLVFCVTTQLITGSKTVQYIKQLEVCSYADAFHYTCLSLTWFIWAIYTVYLIKIRNIKSSFNEFRESVVIYIVGFSTIIETTMLHGIVPKYPLHKYIRLISACFDFFTGNIVIWIYLGYPAYMCMFHHEEYLKKWLRKLANDGLSKEYDIKEAQIPLSTTSYSRMEDDAPHNKNKNLGLSLDSDALGNSTGATAVMPQNQYYHHHHHHQPDTGYQRSSYAGNQQHISTAAQHQSRTIEYDLQEHGYSLQSLSIHNQSQDSLYGNTAHLSSSPRNLV
ncbi:hypothetical protein GQ54DRAFT_282883 [Martensiomyces pterosporus]|nr:hypothetical protein GQ54DRAFT_282883 [Martensiomyces pterosporus]